VQAEELEREHKENNDRWLQQQQRRRSVDLQPGFAPASFFSATNIRHDTSPAPYHPLLSSECVSRVSGVPT
jgi:hypothetical protein